MEINVYLGNGVWSIGVISLSEKKKKSIQPQSKLEGAVLFEYQ
jgi:hypothetical protein